jgi:uncharacterized protein (TIGR02444 family)
MSHAFWDWSLGVYDRAEVRETVLALQDRHGLNVNICLWCAWLASEGRSAEPLLAKAVETLSPWSSDITQPIRTVRRRLKASRPGERLYKSLLACELDAEQIEQNMLFDLSDPAPAAPPGAETARTALEAYARLAQAEIDFDDFVKAVFLTAK